MQNTAFAPNVKKFCENKNANGSAMVGVVVLVAVMSIAAAGLLGTVRNTASQEVDTHNDAKAYLAAEAGLLAGARHFLNGNADAFEFEILHDDVPVTVSINPILNEDNRVNIVSRAQHPDLPHVKVLEWGVERHERTTGDNAVFVDNANTEPGFRRTTIFDGPVHSNTPIILRSDMPLFRDNVTVVNKPPLSQYYGIGPVTGNNYNHGISATQGSHTSASLDGQGDPSRGFKKKFSVSDDIYGMEFDNRPGALLSGGMTTQDDIVWHRLTEPAAAFLNGSFLRFGIDGRGQTNGSGNACNDCATFFRQTANNQWTPQYIPIRRDGTAMIIYADFMLNVRDGNIPSGSIISVRVDGAANDINLDLDYGRINSGHLKYADASITGVPPRNTNTLTPVESYINNNRDNNFGLSDDTFLAFYSERNININRSSSSYNNNAWNDLGSSGTPRDAGGNGTSSNPHILTAQLLAPNGRVTQPIQNQGANANISIFGVISAKNWWVISTGTGENDVLRIFHDTRKLNAPGVTIGIVGEDGLLIRNDEGDVAGTGRGVTVNRWIERNCRRGDVCES